MNSPLPAVDVIVPVYRNLQATQRCIESVLRAEPGPRARLLVINDASPEPDVTAYCKSLAESDQITLLENDTNLGFVATVNRGMAVSGDNDVVLLNSDTEVANDWLERLQRAAHAQAQFGTATPLSNNASVCSYPLPLEENQLPPGWSLSSLDQAAATANEGQVLEVPTAVGFCMYIKRACLDQVGLFDVENFGLGYGEECDFSMRAREQDWVNILAGDVFVYHEGGQSFAGTTDNRIAQAEQTLHRLHPQYHVDATRFIDEDPVRPLRDAIDRQRLQQSPGDAADIINALVTLRDRRTDRRSNREMGLEHGFNEMRQQQDAVQQQIEDLEQQAVSLGQHLQEARDEFEKTTAALATSTAAREAEQQRNEALAQELERLQFRDRRWRYVLGAVNRLDRFREGG